MPPVVPIFLSVAALSGLAYAFVYEPYLADRLETWLYGVLETRRQNRRQPVRAQPAEWAQTSSLDIDMMSSGTWDDRSMNIGLMHSREPIESESGLLRHRRAKDTTRTLFDYADRIDLPPLLPVSSIRTPSNELMSIPALTPDPTFFTPATSDPPSQCLTPTDPQTPKRPSSPSGMTTSSDMLSSVSDISRHVLSRSGSLSSGIGSVSGSIGFETDDPFGAEDESSDGGWSEV
ncbi:hypothetical protein [Phaffia rhodozyma]|uniref:Uncharacterized protein n=1 Tax=Phaffia rhodozyma TaxID=264483 RepID=A0A0F7SHA3_PHARH|nr:hypothetical protein [Phaffia rhodozyma]